MVVARGNGLHQNTHSINGRSRYANPYVRMRRPGAPLSPGLTMNDASLREPVHSTARRLQTCYKRCPSA